MFFVSFYQQLWLRVPLVRADNESSDETFGIFVSNVNKCRGICFVFFVDTSYCR